MTIYWIYDLPLWLFGLLSVLFGVSASILGLLISRPFVSRFHRGDEHQNDVVSYYFAAVGVFYGLTLGLIAVETYQNYIDSDNKVAAEAHAIASIYYDLDGFPQPLRGELTEDLKKYVKHVIDDEWSKQKTGEHIPLRVDILEDLENRLMAYDPVKDREKNFLHEAIRTLDELLIDRETRIQATKTALPAVLWWVVLAGAGINVGLTFFFKVDDLKLHTLLVSLFATSLALLIFITAAMDNPFRGELGVTAEAFQEVLDNVFVNRPH